MVKPHGFGIAEREIGIIYTRTGRRFFNDRDLEQRFLDRIRAALTAAGFWEEFQTTWFCLDSELMPWSAKAQELLRGQYSAVGAAGNASLPEAVAALAQTTSRLSGEALNHAQAVQTQLLARRESIQRFVAAYRHYCWPVESLDDLKLAPFHLLASEGQVHIHQNLIWHMETLAKVCGHDVNLLLATNFRSVDLTVPTSEQDAITWWESLTSRGVEGMVIKPLEFVERGKKGLVQPALKCRGPEYQRIMYGPDYTADEHHPRLRNRSVSGKRSLALREFALGIEALERFVRKEPLRRVHECVFGVLALESEPVDPRL
jgi:protein phosphatase